MDQKSAPIADMLLKHASNKHDRYHMPGHKGNLSGTCGFLGSVSAFDVTELADTDNLYHPSGAIRQAQQLAAEAFGAYRSYFLTCGSSIGIAVMLSAALKENDKLILFRNSHRSVTDALCLIGARPVYIQNKQGENGLLLPPKIKAVEETIRKNPDAKALLVTNPDYYGICPDLHVFAELAHNANMLLLVDEAHGAHLPFYEKLPASASAAGADIWVQSVHKTLGGLTQAALLHIVAPQHSAAPQNGENEPIQNKIERLLPMLSTSSPSYLIMASIDTARAELFTTVNRPAFMQKVKALRTEIDQINGLSVLCAPEECALDITRLVVDTSLVTTGFAAQKFLIEHNIVPECADFSRIVLILTPYDASYERLLKTFKLLTEYGQKSADQSIPSLPDELPRQVLLPRQAAFAVQEPVPFYDAQGRIAGENIGVYPPGIPVFVCGEQIDAGGIDYIGRMQNAGADSFGLQNGFVSVVKN